jgi:hypothetical protein
MKPKIVTIVLVVSFIGLAVFGFLLMHGSLSGYVGLCIAALGGGTGSCPHGTLAAAYFHLNAFRSFSNILPAAASVLLIFVLALSVFGLSPSRQHDKEKVFSALWFPAAVTTSLFALAWHLGKWFVLREREAVSAF